jgi:hypothetical protein
MIPPETRSNLQRQIAALAARRMVADGEEAERAKFKAAAELLGAGARQAGALPDQEQLAAALREDLRCYGGPAHRRWLQRRRRTALEWMQRLERFAPRLTGAVLDGSATPAARIELVLVADSAKEVEMALLELGVDFRVDEVDSGQRQPRQRIGFVARGDDTPEDGAFGVARGSTLRGTPVLLGVLARHPARGAERHGADAPQLHPVERCTWADAAQLQRLIDEREPAPAEAARDG